MSIIIFVSILLLLCYITLLLYYRSAWINLPQFTLDKNYQPSTSISIIIAARNEEANIKRLLQDILSQYYPTRLMEIIVIDDHSTDKTAQIVQEFRGVRLLKMQDVTQGKSLNSYKKKAIEYGVSQASNELIITTDADCNMHAYWLLSIVSFYEIYHPQFIAAPVMFHPILNWFYRFQAIDFMTMQGITGAVVYNKIGSMCNGANLAYTKSAFNAVNGFQGIDEIASGDDMLLMNKIERSFPGQTKFLKCDEAIVSTQAMPNFIAFINQRIRWASKSAHFKDRNIKLVLLLVFVFNLSLLLLGFAAFFKWTNFATFLFLFFSKTLFEYYFLFQLMKFFKQKFSLIQFIVLQPLHVLYILISSSLGQKGTFTWKGRKVK